MSDKIEDEKLKKYIIRVFANYCGLINNIEKNPKIDPEYSKEMQYLMDQFNLIWSYDSEIYKKIIKINEEHIKPISTGGNIYTKEHHENMKTLADYVANNNITREKIFEILNKLNYDKISDIVLLPKNEPHIKNTKSKLITNDFMNDFNNKFQDLRHILTQLKIRDNFLVEKIHKLIKNKKMGNIFWEYIIDDLYKNQKKIVDKEDFRKYLYINSDLMKFLYLYKDDDTIMFVDPVVHT